MDTSIGERLIKARARIVEGFDQGNWEELGLLTGTNYYITHHPRLLRSLSWNDEDYSGNVLTVLRTIVEQDPKRLITIESYLDRNFEQESQYISAKPAEKKITFSPYVFEVPDLYVELDLVSLMMPFSAEFNETSNAVKMTASKCGLRCLRADDIWDESVIIQDIFNLIFKAQIVVADFTGKNQNVMYETGIAHTLGKHVIPISQSIDDVPFDMRHHRVLKYLNNKEGLEKLTNDLYNKFKQFSLTDNKQEENPNGDDEFKDDLPF